MIMAARSCPREDCVGYVGFKSRVITCHRSEHLGVTDIECDTCDFVMWNIFRLKCQTSDEDLIELIGKDAEENEFGISISEAAKKYNITGDTAYRVFKKMGAMDDE